MASFVSVTVGTFGAFSGDQFKDRLEGGDARGNNDNVGFNAEHAVSDVESIRERALTLSTSQDPQCRLTWVSYIPRFLNGRLTGVVRSIGETLQLRALDNGHCRCTGRHFLSATFPSGSGLEPWTHMAPRPRAAHKASRFRRDI